jgi:hypothetical protein
MFGRHRIALDAGLWERIERCARVAGYASPEEFVLHVLEKELAGLEDAGSDADLRAKLRGLGYIE